MARVARASAVAAAKKISVLAVDDGPSGTRQSAPTKRKREEREEREEELSEYEDSETEEEEVEEEDVKEEEENDTSDTTASPPARTTKKAPAARKRATTASNNSSSQKLYVASLCKRLFSVGPEHQGGVGATSRSCCPPERRHGVDYHRPLLLDGRRGRAGRRALLAWYDGVSTARGMPWRQPWVHPDTLAGDPGSIASASPLARRAYEVWISEVMAQQTRIAVVVDYWTRWMARWPTVADLAAAAPADVLAAWRGLGYYSRAARLHAAARALVAHPDPAQRGLLPADAAELQARVAGVGRYTAGAVSAIVFGRAAAMVDGNVVRVLSRQMGLYAAAGGAAAMTEEEGGSSSSSNNSLSQKTLVDLFWAAAEALVAVVARDGEDDTTDIDGDDTAWAVSPPRSDRPGRWGQALMELGSTVCTPSPHCGACPIQTTCRAYGEGQLLHEARQSGGKGLSLEEAESCCSLCEPFPEDVDDGEEADAGFSKRAPRKKQKTKKPPEKEHRSAYFDVEDTPVAAAAAALPTIVAHARQFPLRRPKKAVRAVETLVCAIRAKDRHGNWSYLLQQRPAKGLLAGLWQLPSYDVPSASSAKLDGKARRREAEAFVGRWWLGKKTASAEQSVTVTVTELGSVPWLFSHLRQTMHVYLFAVSSAAGKDLPPPPPVSACWASAAEAEDTYTMGTGMRKCWHLLWDAE